MNGICKSLKQGYNNRFALVARWAPVLLRLIGNAKLSKGPEAFVLIWQEAARVYDRAIYGGETKNA